MGEKKITKVTVLPSISDYDDGLRRSKRVAAYCRVSTLAEEQETSLIAQQDYYYKYIRSQDNWELINIYYDDGISGLSFHNRDGFNDMIDDALSGKIDLILTKSLSRFARNTVDTLVIIRKLKEKGVEVYFEKENIWTMDSKGEFLITLMSSLAQEESRSMSENVTWGLRKCFSDGKYHVPYAHFLGYSRGGVHTMVVNPDEEATVRLIFLMSIMGLTNAYIAKFLQSNNIPTPGNGVRWRDSTIRSILDNEKYCGNALLQKTFTTDFLSKSRKVNEGEVPQYFIENGHEAIISGDVADLTAAEKDRRRSFGKTYSCIPDFRWRTN